MFDNQLGTLPPGPGPEYEGLGVQCVHHVTRRKLSGVSVRWALQAELDAWVAANPGRNLADTDPETILDEIFPKTKRASVSGDGGVALTPSAPGRILVDARQGALYGYSWVDRGRSPRTTIALVEDRDVFFRVPGPGDAPRVGVPVVLRDSSCVEIWRGVTQGSDGIARMRHAGFLVARDASPGDCVALVDGVCPSAALVTVSPASLPLGDVDLPLPATGRVVVTAKDERGERVRVPYVVRLASPGADACGRTTSRVLVDGVATFDVVEPGVPLVVTLDGFDDYAPVTLATTGPDAAGAERAVEIAFRSRLPAVKLHLVEAPEIPVLSARGAAWLEGRVDGAPVSIPARREWTTDEDGRVRVVFDLPPAGLVDAHVFVALRNTYGDWYSSGRFPLPGGVLAGAIDLGRCVVREMPTLAAGYVLDDRNGPVPEAVVEISASDDPAAPTFEFRLEPRWTTTADSMGRFRLRGFVEGARLALCASAPDHVRPDPREIPRGERKVALALPRASSIQGRLFLPDRMPIDDVRIWVTSGGETVPGLIQPGGAYRVATIAPGTAELSVLVAGFDEPVYAVPGLTARPGVEINDANVVSIDLRSRLSYLSVFVLGPDEKPVTHGVARVIEDDGEARRERVVPLRSGFASFYARTQRVDVVVEADGYDPTTLTALDRDTEVRLVPRAR